MTRLLLTFLALLTGLVAQVSPAQTIVRGAGAEIGVTIGSARAERRAAPAAHPVETGRSARPEDSRCTILMRVPAQDCAPVTYIGSDRSLD